MIMISDYAAKLLHEERSARLQDEAANYRLARAARRRQERPVAVRHGNAEPVESARVPRPRRQREPVSVSDSNGQDDIAHVLRSNRRAA